MPQVFQVLKCYKCLVFQVHQTKKSNKFECKMCGEKQSIKRHYGIGTGMECRLHVQQLNGIKGVMDMNFAVLSEGEDDSEPGEPISHNIKSSVTKQAKQSKWSAFVDHQEEAERDQLEDSKEHNMSFGEGEMLESPQRRKRKNVKTKTRSSYDLGRKPKNLANTFNDKLQNSWKVKKINEIFKLDSEVNCKSLEDVEKICNEMSFTHKDSVSNNNVITNKQSSQKQDVLNTLNRSSKWTQFISAEEECANIQNDSSLSNHELEESVPKHKDLFSLSDDNNLDDVLNI